MSEDSNSQSLATAKFSSKNLLAAISASTFPTSNGFSLFKDKFFL